MIHFLINYIEASLHCCIIRLTPATHILNHYMLHALIFCERDLPLLRLSWNLWQIFVIIALVICDNNQNERMENKVKAQLNWLAATHTYTEHTRICVKGYAKYIHPPIQRQRFGSTLIHKNNFVPLLWAFFAAFAKKIICIFMIQFL